MALIFKGLSKGISLTFSFVKFSASVLKGVITEIKNELKWLIGLIIGLIVLFKIKNKD